MRYFAIGAAMLFAMIGSPAQAVTRYQIGTGTTLGGFCRWYAFMDTYPDGSYRVYYETDCGANGFAVPRDRFGNPKSLAQMRAETLMAPAAVEAGKQAPRIARRFVAEAAVKSGRAAQ
jgi:hypothetical protein